MKALVFVASCYLALWGVSVLNESIERVRTERAAEKQRCERLEERVKKLETPLSTRPRHDPEGSA